MHLVALNIIMWIRTLIKESIEEIIEFEDEHRVSILLACRSPRCHHTRWIHSAIVKFQTGHHAVSKKRMMQTKIQHFLKCISTRKVLIPVAFVWCHQMGETNLVHCPNSSHS